MSLDDARTTLLDADLQVGQITSAESRYEPGTVIQQSPEAATRVRRSTPVALVIANPIMIFVPPVTNRPMKDARSILSNAGLQIGTVTAVESDNEPGIVLEQSPEAGSRAPRGSSVSLAVSTPRMVNVPPVVGLELAAAREVLERSGLVPVTDAMHSQNDQALVTSQNPEPSSTVRRGSSVVLTLRAVAEPPAIEPPSPPALTPLPWTAIITGAAAITILAGALLFMRSIRTKPAPPAREPHVSIREKLDYGTQQVQATGNPEKAPTISITVRADQGDQEIRPS
ncbi:PASTA domain-containing protein [Chlorobaculum sp. MV4-Y]|uniref:PASTA domain-containing protein n=1 Tax=Chlorobaculum sp. MV4-Y TaxID=2976335 RepID=UPI0021AEDD18|nr:PASTA domain-containing protein [Chlorobaculum sp. MV4-Y]UWX57557.1 PASTA domain-containing protein [Chlorobaculum sp. MV4-Y]